MTPADLTKALLAAKPGAGIDCAGYSFPRNFRIPSRAYGGVTLQGGTFTAPYCVSVSGLVFEDCVTADGQFVSCQHLLFDGCTFTGGSNALTLVHVSDSEIRDCDFGGLVADGVHATLCQRVNIHDNEFHNFSSAPGVHSDFIQFFVGAATQASEDITVHHNLFDARQSPLTQGAFFSNENPKVATYQRVTITDNLYLGPANQAPPTAFGIGGHADTVMTGNTACAAHGGQRNIVTDTWAHFKTLANNRANHFTPLSPAPPASNSTIPPYTDNGATLLAEWRAKSAQGVR